MTAHSYSREGAGIVLQRGKPVPEARVMVRSAEMGPGGFQEVRADMNGRFSIPRAFAPGELTIYARRTTDLKGSRAGRVAARHGKTRLEVFAGARSESVTVRISSSGQTP